MVESRKYQHAFDVDSLEQHADMNLRRQITRNKPLKVRALQSECITKKFLHPEKRQKSEDIQRQPKILSILAASLVQEAKQWCVVFVKIMGMHMVVLPKYLHAP
jgi:hypothetical protein